MLGFQSIEGLANALKMEVADILLAVKASETHPNPQIAELTAIDPKRRPRDVIAVKGELRIFQSKLHRLLQQRILPSKYCFGSVLGRNLKQHVQLHIGNCYVLKMDVADFYPSISSNRVFRFFLYECACSPKVSHVLTRLCTHDYHLALGLITSPTIANSMLRRFDSSVGELCDQYSSRYSRWVDDITISSRWNLKESKIVERVCEIMKCNGLRERPEKRQFGEFPSDIQITGLCVEGRTVRVPKSFLSELERQIDDHVNLSNGADFDGPLSSFEQLHGRICHAGWISPGLKQPLMTRFRRIDWRAVRAHATQRGLAVLRKTVGPRNHSNELQSSQP